MRALLVALTDQAGTVAGRRLVLIGSSEIAEVEPRPGNHRARRADLASTVETADADTDRL